MSICLPSAFLLVCICLLSYVLTPAQVLVNGQLITNGLAVIDAPAPNSNYQVGGTIAIIIDVSGHGKLSQSAEVPESSLSSCFQELQLFLISDSIEFNMTISDGYTLLYEESSSTVRHKTWTIPSCTPSGNYNITLYETSVIKDEAFYTITPIPIVISSSYSGMCSSLNQFQTISQTSSSLSLENLQLTLWCTTCSTAKYGTLVQSILVPSPSGSWGDMATRLTTVSSGLTTTATVVTSIASEPPMSSIDFVGFIPVGAAEHPWMSSISTLTVGGLTILTIMTFLF